MGAGEGGRPRVFVAGVGSPRHSVELAIPCPSTLRNSAPPRRRWSMRILMILAVGMLLLPAGCGDPESPPPPEGRSVTEGYVEAGDGVELFFRVVGDGPDTVVVLHGGPGFSMEYFAEDLEPLAERLTLLFYDQRGTGRSTLVSDSAGLAAPVFAEDLEAVRRHFGMERLTLLGHSWGPAVATLYGGRYPERVGRLLFVGPTPPRRALLVPAFQDMQASRDTASLRQMEERREAWLADPGDADLCRAYYVLWFEPFFADVSDAARSRGDFCAGSPGSLENKVNSVDVYTQASLGDWDFRETTRTLSVPTLVIHGTEDPLPLEGAREWARIMPDARLLVLDGIGHFPYLEAPDVFFPAVEQFVLGDWPEEAQEVR